jgi:hypothetical protein
MRGSTLEVGLVFLCMLRSLPCLGIDRGILVDWGCTQGFLSVNFVRWFGVWSVSLVACPSRSTTPRLQALLPVQASVTPQLFELTPPQASCLTLLCSRSHCGHLLCHVYRRMSPTGIPVPAMPSASQWAAVMQQSPSAEMAAAFSAGFAAGEASFGSL